jgi:hypothetical protein
VRRRANWQAAQVAFSERLRWYFLPVALIPLAVIRASLLAEPDTFWQIRVGLDILRSHRIPATDSYSWTAYGTEWHPNSWAFDVLLAGAFKFGGLTAAALAAAAFIPIAGLCVGLLARRLGARPGVTALVVFLCFTALIVWFSARPQMVDYAAVPLLLLLVDVAMTSARTSHRWQAIAGIGVLQIVWVNLHLVAPLGVALAAIAGAGYLIKPVRTRASLVITGAAVVAAAGLGTLISPFGWSVVAIATDVHDSSAVIIEWGHFTFTDYVSDILLAICLLGTVAAWRLRHPALLLSMVALTGAGLYAIRMLPIATIVAVALLAAWADASPRRSAYADSRRNLIRFAVGGLILAEAVVAAVKGSAPSEVRYPQTLVERMPGDCRLFNDYTFGGVVILLRPEILVNQDSRSDLYGRDALIAANDTEFNAGGPAALDKYDVTCVLITPDSTLDSELHTRADWYEVGRDAYGALYVRNPAA